MSKTNRAYAIALGALTFLAPVQQAEASRYIFGDYVEQPWQYRSEDRCKGLAFEPEVAEEDIMQKLCLYERSRSKYKTSRTRSNLERLLKARSTLSAAGEDYLIDQWSDGNRDAGYKCVRVYPNGTYGFEIHFRDEGKKVKVCAPHPTGGLRELRWFIPLSLKKEQMYKPQTAPYRDRKLK